MTDLTINIDAVSLDGVPMEQRPAVMAAFRRELALALSQGATIATPNRGLRSTLAVPLAQLRGPDAIGRAMARRLIDDRQ